MLRIDREIGEAEPGGEGVFNLIVTQQDREGILSALAASPGDVAIGLAAGGILGAAIGSSAASAPPQPLYAVPAPAGAPTLGYPAPAAVVSTVPAPVYVDTQPVFVASAPVVVVGPYRRHRYYW